MEDIIKRAIEGGYKEGEKWQFVRANRYWAEWLDGNGTSTTIRVELYFLDPLFWQALGKACGWNWAICMTCDMKVPLFGECQCDEEESEYPKPVIGWKFNALHFHEINLTQGWDKAVEWLKELVDKSKE